MSDAPVDPRAKPVAEAAIPRVLGNTTERTRAGIESTEVAWKLDFPDRGLDSNLIRLAPGGAIGAHRGGEVDVLVHILAGSGTVGTEADDVAVTAGDLLWLPHHSLRSFTAGSDGLSYLTVHAHREPSLTIEPFNPNR